MASVRRQLISGSAYRISLRASRIGVSIFLTPFIIASLGDEMYGVWTLVGAFMGAYGLLDLGLAFAVNRHVSVALGANDPARVRSVVSSALFLYVLLGSVVMAVVLAGAYPAGWIVEDPEQQHALRIVMILLGVSLATSFPLKVYGGVLEAHFRFDLLDLPWLVTTYLGAGLTVLALVLGYGIIGVATVAMTMTLSVGLSQWYMAHRLVPETRFSFSKVERSTLRDLFNFGGTGFIIQLADVVRFQFDVVVIQLFLGVAAVTSYRVPSLVILFYTQLMQAVTGPLQPYMSKLVGEENERKEEDVFFIGLRLSAYLALFMGVMLVMMGRELIGVWIGDRFVEHYNVLLVLTVAWFVLLSQGSMNTYLYAKARHKILAWRNVCEAILNLGLSLILVRHYGILGVALGTAIPMVIGSAIAMPPFVCRVVRISIWQFYRVWFTSIGVGALGLILPVFIIHEYMEASWWHIFGLGSVSLACYLPVIWFVECGDIRQPMAVRTHWLSEKPSSR